MQQAMSKYAGGLRGAVGLEHGRLELALRQIDLGVTGRVDHQRRLVVADRVADRGGVRDVGLGAGQGNERHAERGARPHHFLTQLAVGAEKCDHATTPRRSPR